MCVCIRLPISPADACGRRACVKQGVCISIYTRGDTGEWTHLKLNQERTATAVKYLHTPPTPHASCVSKPAATHSPQRSYSTHPYARTSANLSEPHSPANSSCGWGSTHMLAALRYWTKSALGRKVSRLYLAVQMRFSA